MKIGRLTVVILLAITIAGVLSLFLPDTPLGAAAATATGIFVGNVVYGIGSTISRGRMVLGSAAGAIAAFVAVWVIWSV